MMKCGHAANAQKGGWPACAICDCDEVVERPDLAGREAACGAKCPVVPSSFDLAFFEYLGPGSVKSFRVCKHCGYFEEAHTDEIRAKHKRGAPCETFEQHGPWEHDRYYCGCKGWD